MSKEFKVGDRVRMRGFDAHGDGVEGGSATVIYIGDAPLIRVKTDGGRLTHVYPSQLRRLKPKRKPRSVWIVSQEVDRALAGDNVCAWISASKTVGDDVEFREVLKPKVKP